MMAKSNIETVSDLNTCSSSDRIKYFRISVSAIAERFEEFFQLEFRRSRCSEISKMSFRNMWNILKPLRDQLSIFKAKNVTWCPKNFFFNCPRPKDFDLPITQFWFFSFWTWHRKWSVDKQWRQFSPVLSFLLDFSVISFYLKPSRHINKLSSTPTKIA